MKYHVCNHCGAFLDHGEKCDCQEEENKKIFKIEKYVRENYKQQKDGQMEMILQKERTKTMNKVILCGRLTRDPEIRYTQGAESMAIARYTLAVDRKYKKEGENTADFISCVAFGKNGEFTEKYLKKGTKLLVTGHIQTGSYTNNDGNKVYTTDVVIDEQEFAESKKAEQEERPAPMPTAASDGFMNIDQGIDEELPFS